MKALLVAASLLATPAFAGEVRVLELDRMSMDYTRLPNNRDVYLPYEDWGRDRHETQETWDYGLGVNWDLNLVRVADDYRLYWNNRVSGQSTTAQFRAVSWDFRWGLQLGPVVDLFYHHLSEHILDEAPAQQRTYRLRNEFGIEMTFYRRD